MHHLRISTSCSYWTYYAFGDCWWMFLLCQVIRDNCGWFLNAWHTIFCIQSDDFFRGSGTLRKVHDTSSQSLVLQLFHKLQKIIEAVDCCCTDNLSKRSNKRPIKSLTIINMAQTVLSSCTNPQHFIAFRQTKNRCIQVLVTTSHDTQESCQWIPFWIILVRVGRHEWAMHQSKQRTLGGTCSFQITSESQVECLIRRSCFSL